MIFSDNRIQIGIRQHSRRDHVELAAGGFGFPPDFFRLSRPLPVLHGHDEDESRGFRHGRRLRHARRPPHQHQPFVQIDKEHFQKSIRGESK